MGLPKDAILWAISSNLSTLLDNMNYYEAPANIYDQINSRSDCIFLAVSITGSSDWQTPMIEKLLPYYHIFNPRRKNFDVTKPEMEKEQIEWEYEALGYCKTIMFYFAPQTLAPITLFEYGKMLMDSDKMLFVCVHPEYKRKNDVLIQTDLENEFLAQRICFDLDTLAEQIINHKKAVDKYRKLL